MTTIDDEPTTVRAFRPSRVHIRTNAPCCELMDAGAKDGLSQLERNQISILNERTALALRVSIEDTIRAVAARFNLNAMVVGVVALDTSADYRIVLAVKNGTS
jgi:hypothetical protein